MEKREWFFLGLPIIFSALFILLSYVPFYQTFENRVYDLYLSVRPETAQDERLLLLDIDDLSISEIGVWPWSRDITARGLLLLREFGSRSVVMDIEYTEDSPMGVNARVLREEIPQKFENEFGEIQNNIGSLFEALASGSIPLDSAEEYITDLQELTEESKQELLEQVRDIARDNDAFYGNMTRLHGNTYFTVSMLTRQDPAVPESLISYAQEHIALDEVSGEGANIAEADGIRPAIKPLLSRAAGAGFPNVVIDSDGVRRRIKPLMEHDGAYYPQLALEPLLTWLGDPAVVLNRQSMTLKNAEHPDDGTVDITIPLTEQGNMLINWPHADYQESFRHLSYYELVYNRELERRLIDNLEVMKQAGYLSFFQGDFPLMKPYRYAESIKEEVLGGGNPGLMSEYAGVRERFFSAAGDFLGGDAEQRIISEIDRILSSDQLSGEQRSSYEEVRAEIPEVFDASRDVYSKLKESRSRLEEEVNGSFVIVGHVGTSTTDIGVTPFAKEYMNVGTHASLVNTILQRDFLDELPEWYAFIIAPLLALLVTIIIRRRNPTFSIFVGLSFVILMAAVSLGAFVWTGVYLSPVVPIFAVFFSFAAITITKYLQTARERVYIKNAFSHYLSNDVINELLSDKEKLKLGGDKKHMTALFTDVKGFSTISETFDPADLVKLLNEYLTEMSDIILDHHGTIDKYEGDAIISFFGAPLEYADHAARACRSAVEMKRAEVDLNRRFQQHNMIPNPIYTRIGINTGEMVVGNMGTDRKMDYTIMGNSVNLAARLEGVNKQYGTWTLVSEPTFQEGGGDFLARRLDRVRVVGINQPVRLYELLEEKTRSEPVMEEALEIFQEGQDLFEERRWEEASGYFERVLKLIPEDGPSQLYLKRCRKFAQKEPPEDWDGVFNLSLK
jgi:adenylate cyclase